MVGLLLLILSGIRLVIISWRSGYVCFCAAGVSVVESTLEPSFLLDLREDAANVRCLSITTANSVTAN